jgi:hypothetical protein
MRNSFLHHLKLFVGLHLVCHLWLFGIILQFFALALIYQKNILLDYLGFPQNILWCVFLETHGKSWIEKEDIIL